MIAIGNIHEVKFPNIYVLSVIIYCTLPLAIIIVLARKAVSFLNVRQSFSNIFPKHCDDIKN